MRSGFKPRPGHCVVFLGNSTITLHPIRGEYQSALAASCYGKRQLYATSNYGAVGFQRLYFLKSPSTVHRRWQLAEAEVRGPTVSCVLQQHENLFSKL